MGFCVNEKGITTPHRFRFDGCAKACDAKITYLFLAIFGSPYYWWIDRFCRRDLIDGLLDFGLVLGISS